MLAPFSPRIGKPRRCQRRGRELKEGKDKKKGEEGEGPKKRENREK